jgi:SAM-dependent methyltransferase
LTTDLPGDAIADFHFTDSPGKLWVYDDVGPRVEMNIAVYFRGREAMPELEQIALAECRGTVLDIGAGAGSHALALQEAGFDVTALEISPASVRVMKDRGVQKVLQEDIFSYSAARYDTLLLLMNGIGLAGDLDGLRALLRHFKTLLNPGGRLLFDSSDVAYLFEDGFLPDDRYYGEIHCQYGYKRQRTPMFSWLYIDFATLEKLAISEGWNCEQLFDDGNDQYLVRLMSLQ